MTRILTLFAAAALIACVTPKATMPPPAPVETGAQTSGPTGTQETPPPDTVGPSGKKKPSASDVSTPQSQ